MKSFINKLLIFMSAFLLLPMVLEIGIEAKTIELENKTYEASYIIGGTSAMGKKMIAKNFESKVMIERIDTSYYLSLTKKSSSIVGLTLVVDGKAAGNMLRAKDGENETYIFALREETIFSEMQFQCYIQAMGMNQSFTITIDNDTIVEIKDHVEDIGQRPLEYGERPVYKKQFPMWGYAAIAGGVLVLIGVGCGLYFGYFRKKKRA